MARGPTVVTGGQVALTVAQTAAAAAAGAALLGAYRSVARRSRWLGLVLAGGMLARAAVGLALFWISYARLPIARGLQVEGGFWRFFLDSTGYFQIAARAADAHTLYALDHAVASPTYTNLLAIWMMVFGVSPATGLFLNLALYTAVAVVLVRAFGPADNPRDDLPCAAALAVYAFSPLMVLNATQPLKEDLSYAMVALACGGVFLLRRLHLDVQLPARRLALGAGALALAVFGISGLRYYYGVIIWIMLAVSFAVLLVVQRTIPVGRYLLRIMALLAICWIAFWQASGPFYGVVLAAQGGSLATIPRLLLNLPRAHRAGFLMTPGNSNVVIPINDDTASGRAALEDATEIDHQSAAYQAQLARQADAAPAPQIPDPEGQRRVDTVLRALPNSAAGHVLALVQGLALVFVPIHLVQALSSVRVPGSTALLTLIDVDTLALDAAIAAVAAFGWRRRHDIADRLPVVVFGGLLAMMTAGLLAYVVTNFGTLMRMRGLVTVSVAMITMALSPLRGNLSAAPGVEWR